MCRWGEPESSCRPGCKLGWVVSSEGLLKHTHRDNKIYVLSCIRCVTRAGAGFKLMSYIYVSPLSLFPFFLVDSAAVCNPMRTTVVSIPLMNGFGSHVLGSADGWRCRVCSSLSMTTHTPFVLAPVCLCPCRAVFLCHM